MRFNIGTKITSRVGCFGPSFITLISSHQYISNVGSKFILSSLEVDHCVVQTQIFFEKLPETADFGFLQQSQNRVRF